MNCIKAKPKVAILELKGKIGVDCELSFKRIRPSIDKAFSKINLKAVCIVINSPGGSAVQSELIAKYLLLKSQKTGVPLYSLVEHCAASGGYLIACAARKIFVCQYSVVGSIGAVIVSYSVEELLAKLGIQPLVLTAGQRKGGLNPLVTPSQEQLDDTRKLLADCHASFISWVETRREGRLRDLQGDKEDIFSGAIFSGVCHPNDSAPASPSSAPITDSVTPCSPDSTPPCLDPGRGAGTG